MEIDARRSFVETEYSVSIKEKIALLKKPLTGRRLVVSDVDSTFIKQEVIDLLATLAGAGEKVSQITDSAMRGELDFAQSLKLRVQVLTDQPVEILDKVSQKIELSDGAMHLVTKLHMEGHVLALVSGGFIQILEPLAIKNGIKYFLANELEISAGFLTGFVKGAVVDAEAKGKYLEQLAASLDIPLRNTIAIGDGANDLIMMQKAGISVSFNGKPKVQQFADVHLNGSFIDHVLALI
jgi:phosphoserine phosphatase